MVKNEVAVIAFSALLLCGCAQSYKWTAIPVDGHMTGVTAPTALNTREALGEVSGGAYKAPSGSVFAEGSTPAVAGLMIGVQPRMADLKQVVAYSENGMCKRAPESPLSNWTVDNVMRGVAKHTGLRVDVGICNFGGIRTEFEKGYVLKDDVVSMFPFKNYLAYCAVKGSTLLDIYSDMARTRVQALGGVKLVIKDHKLVSATIAGEPIDPDRVYGLATIDFLLDGGDGLKLAENALEVVKTDCLVIDYMLPMVLECAARGESIDYQMDGRIVIE